MITSGSVEITTLLKAWSAGDCMARDQLMPLVYNELKRLARRCMRKERTEATLQTTALVHEAYLRLVGLRPDRLARPCALLRGGRRNDATHSGRCCSGENIHQAWWPGWTATRIHVLSRYRRPELSPPHAIGS